MIFFDFFEIEKFSKIFENFHSKMYENEKIWDRKNDLKKIRRQVEVVPTFLFFIEMFTFL